ncbi:ScbA/BarX family gamma-butyrolactone biosynthesis protein [Gordonia jinhuaensis]|uniref:Adhesin n=1 Tax=Gordonia jinhuaensis TaxID=1517702 RepID=A0A916WUA3_9ACTN|nr:AfsA-related hotdog domain-containing protein [Gordonia jinhuaensis]GGB33328.1 adhesin [Gordonia jinhuaensis]
MSAKAQMYEPGRAARELVHRASDNEVFVTPPEYRGDRLHANWALMPHSANAYYYDGLDDPQHDPIFLAELMRQAAMSGAHEFTGVPTDIAMFFIEMSLTNHPRIPTSTTSAESNPRMRIETSLDDIRYNRARDPRRIKYSQTASIDGDLCASTEVIVQGARRSKYQDLRTYQRDGVPAPRTSSLPRRPTNAAAPPSMVGRHNTANVVLRDLESHSGRTTAALSPDYHNTSLFDHDYDHIPGMVLLEAARQITHAAEDGAAPPLRRFHSTFHSFAELDRPLRIEYQRVDDTAAATIEFTHDDKTAAIVTVQFVSDEGPNR